LKEIYSGEFLEMKQKVKSRLEKIERSIEGMSRLGRWKPDKFKENKKRKRKKGVIANV
jgi:hypothetical protein